MNKLNLRWQDNMSPDIDAHNLQLMTDEINSLVDETEALGNKLSEISGMTTKSYSLVDTQSGEQSKSMTYPKNATHIIMMATHNDILEGSATIDLVTNTITATSKTVEVDLFNKYVGTLWNENHIENNTVEAYKGEGNFILHWNGDDGFGDETVTINNGVLTAISSYNTLGVAIIAITEGMTINAKDVYYEDGKNVEETKATLMPKAGVWMDEWELSPRKIRLGNVDQPQNTTIEEDRIRVYENNEDDSIRTETEIVEGDVRIHNNNPSKGSKYTYSLLDVGENTNKNVAEITNIKHDLSQLVTVDKNIEKRVTNLEYASQGILYRADVDDSEAITKNVDSGALPYASLDVIGAKSVVLNQLITPNIYNSRTLNGITCVNNGDGSYTFSGTSTASVATFATRINKNIIEKHKYYFSRSNESTWGQYGCYITDGLSATSVENESIIVEASANSNGFTVRFGVWRDYEVNNFTVKPMLIDLTQMFGTGNEPTLEICQQMFNGNYYPYNEGSIKNANLKEIVSKSENGTEISKIDVSTLINKYFPQGMRSAGSVFDVIDLVNGKAVKKVDVFDLGAPNWKSDTNNRFYASISDFTGMKRPSNNNEIANLLCDGYTTTYKNNSSNLDKGISLETTRTLYIRDTSFSDASAFKSAMNGHTLIYELETPIETPISEEDIEKFKYLTVEGGGTLYFKTLDEFDVAIPTTETFAIKTGGAV